MKIIDIVTEDIGDIKTIIEILNGFISEANADFIKDIELYNKRITNDNNNSSDSKTTSESLSDSENINTDSRVRRKKKKKRKREKKEKTLDSDIEEDCEEENKGCIKILTSDPNQVMITLIKLNGSSFSKFNILPDIYSVGLNLDELYKYLKNVNKDAIMRIHVDSDDTQHIVFNVSSENGSNESVCELRVLNLINKRDRKIETGVQMSVRINCSLFHKTCKDLLQFSQYIELTCDPTKLVITCKGDLSTQSRTFKADGKHDSIVINTNNSEDEKTPNIIKLIFDLKYINTMYKCIGLCEDMRIFLNSDSVMFLKYDIKLKGEMIVGIAPSGQNKNHSDNYDEDDELFYQDDEEIILR
jgi:hypothetical protein